MKIICSRFKKFLGEKHADKVRRERLNSKWKSFAPGAKNSWVKKSPMRINLRRMASALIAWISKKAKKETVETGPGGLCVTKETSLFFPCRDVHQKIWIMMGWISISYGSNARKTCMKFCPKCNCEYLDEAMFCGDCKGTLFGHPDGSYGELSLKEKMLDSMKSARLRALSEDLRASMW